VRGNPDGLELLDEEREPRDLGPGKGGSSDMLLQELDGESGSEMTEMVRVRLGMGSQSQSASASEAGELS
jgi:hypothetical protein